MGLAMPMRFSMNSTKFVIRLSHIPCDQVKAATQQDIWSVRTAGLTNAWNWVCQVTPVSCFHFSEFILEFSVDKFSIIYAHCLILQFNFIRLIASIFFILPLNLQWMSAARFRFLSPVSAMLFVNADALRKLYRISQSNHLASTDQACDRSVEYWWNQQNELCDFLLVSLHTVFMTCQ